MLLSLALWPLFAADFWHRHYGKITAVWGILFLAPFTFVFGPGESVHQVVHALLLEYLPFVILLLLFVSLHTVAAGFGWVGSQQIDDDRRQRIPFAPSVAAALVITILSGCLRLPE